MSHQAIKYITCNCAVFTPVTIGVKSIKIHQEMIVTVENKMASFFRTRCINQQKQPEGYSLK